MILTQAVEAIAHLPHTQVLRVSSWMENPAVGIPDGPDFLNGVVEIETSLSPQELLHRLQKIEWDNGRIRSISNTPHPRMKEREFVMKPLGELRGREK